MLLPDLSQMVSLQHFVALSIGMSLGVAHWNIGVRYGVMKVGRWVQRVEPTGRLAYPRSGGRVLAGWVAIVRVHMVFLFITRSALTKPSRETLTFDRCSTSAAT